MPDWEKTVRLRLFAFLVVGMVLSPMFSETSWAISFEEAKQGTVRIVAKVVRNGEENTSVGTGFVLNKEGVVATNYHVVWGGRKIGVIFEDGGEPRMESGELIWASQAKDLALVRVEDLPLSPLPLSRVKPKIKDKAFALGFPTAIEQPPSLEEDVRTQEEFLQSSINVTYTEGNVIRDIFSAPWFEGGPELPLVPHSASVNSGNSGGPLLNACNQVIGINTQTSKSELQVAREKGGLKAVGKSTQGIYWASHISALIEVLEDKDIGYTEITEPCSSPSRPVWLNPWMIGGALALAALAFLFSLRRPRQQIVHQIETYSQWIRRKEREGMSPSQTILRLEGKDSQGSEVSLRLKNKDFGSDGTSYVNVGREEESNDVILGDPTVSRRHVRIKKQGKGRFTVEDLDSSNGTFVNGKPLTPYTGVSISDRDSLRIGKVELRVQA